MWVKVHRSIWTGTSKMTNSEQTPADEAFSELLAAVPKTFAERFTALVGLTDAFCEARLNDEYRHMCREMAVSICQRGSPVRKGKPGGWAAGIVYALGRVNFLGDPSQNPHMKSKEIAEGFGVSMATMQAKKKVIWDGLDLMQLHPDWCLSSFVDDNPMIWMLKVNGFIMDIRTAPREVQAVAYEKGLIPYIPADREDAAGDGAAAARGDDDE